MTDRPTVIWTEIPVTDLDAAKKFYSEVFGWTMVRDESGPNPIENYSNNFSGVGGHLYSGKPGDGNGPTLHLALPDKIEAGAARAVIAGATLLGPVIDIPPGRFQYATDPDGNSIGLFEPKAA
ncbi:VOC family protein [Octadecabacter antarcticus]|nr:VOC family protein [Octadecabacter antarcticus]